MSDTTTPPRPDAPAGWYPDPSQAETQRYWDGENWTDQRAPLAPSLAAGADRGISLSTRLVLGVLGAVAALIAVFLPHAESSGVLKIANNTLISSSDGLIVIVLALVAAAAAVRDAAKQRLSWSLVLLGLVVIGIAFYEGGSEQIKIVNGLGQEVESSAGPAVWVLGISGALMVAAGFARWRRPRLSSAGKSPAREDT
jgi:hypothetical protein